MFASASHLSASTRAFLSLLLTFFVASVSMAQLPTATILGIVKDSTGAVVPGGHRHFPQCRYRPKPVGADRGGRIIPYSCVAGRQL